VGVGTSSPTLASGWNRVLHVQSAGTGSSVRLADSVSGTSGDVGLLIGQLSNYSYLVNRDSGGMSFWTNNTEHMGISAAGIVTKQKQPAFGVSGNLYTSSAIFRGNTVHSNIGSHFNTTTGIFTAPVAGTYSFMFNLSTQDTQSHFVDIFINSLSVIGHSLQYGVIYSTGSMAINVTLAANDTVSARKRGSSYATYNAAFSGHLIG